MTTGSQICNVDSTEGVDRVDNLDNRTINASFQCTFGLMGQLRQRAISEERSVSSLIRHALRLYLRTPHGSHPNPLRDAL
jgi:hypothetical protein